MKGYIITGASRGLGLGFARELMRPGHLLRCVSRSPNPDVLREAEAAGCDARWFAADLSRVDELGGLMHDIFATLDPRDAGGLTLINNAGVVDPIGQLHRVSPEAVVTAVNVNLTAVLLLSLWFARLSSGCRGARTVINITSGAARHPYQGMCLYCVTKAGVDMLTRCAALEESGVRMVAVAPGVLDTDMQRRTRETDAEGFAERDRYIRLKAEGRLGSPREAAGRILRVVADGLTSGSVVDMRDFTI
ncbi:MAG: SDR family NAD(P)-dependent oxidoreductase [Spirochaetota bacterium]